MLVLASNSPRRRQLLAIGGWEFIVQPVDLDERVLPGEAPGVYVRRLAEEKARAAAHLLDGRRLLDDLVVAADTAVVEWLPALQAARILGKPANAAEAAKMLGDLRGCEHQVYTGIAVLRLGDNRLLSDVCITRVQMRMYGDDEIQAYIDSGDPLDKAGAYAIQHSGFHPVEKLDGCFANVVGLPLCRLTNLLEAQAAPPSSRITERCGQQPGLPCQVYLRVLEEA
jgi:MAF protein